MKYYYITFRSITFAQQGERVLGRAGIPCALIRTPKHLQERGCSYCLRIRTVQAGEVLELLEKHGLSFGKIYVIRENGTAEEREL